MALSRIGTRLILLGVTLWVLGHLSCQEAHPAPKPLPKPVWRCPEKLPPGDYKLNWNSTIRRMQLLSNGVYLWGEESEPAYWTGSWISSSPKTLQVSEVQYNPATGSVGQRMDWTLILDERGDGKATTQTGNSYQVQVRPWKKR